MTEILIPSVHIIGSRTMGGAENFYVRLVHALRETGQPVTAVNPPGSDVGAALGSAIEQNPIPMRSIYDPLARWRIKTLLRKQRPTIVQTYMGRATRLTHVQPNQGTVHVARLGGFYDPKGYRHAHAWIGNTRGICAHLTDNGFPAERVFYIGNFVEPAPATSASDLALLRGSLGIPSDAKVVLGLGRLHPNKDFGTLLEAFSQAIEQYTSEPLHLVIAGDGPSRLALQTYAHELGLDDRVHWPGWITLPTPYFHLADVFVCPSRHEPLGNVILEAWAHGVPVISTKTHGAEELLVDGENGELVAVQDSAAMGSKIVELLALSETKRSALIEQGLQTLAREHSKAAVVHRYLDVYRQLSGAKP